MEPSDHDYEMLAIELRHLTTVSSTNARAKGAMYIRGLGEKGALELLLQLAKFLSEIPEKECRCLLPYHRHKLGLE